MGVSAFAAEDPSSQDTAPRTVTLNNLVESDTDTLTFSSVEALSNKARISSSIKDYKANVVKLYFATESDKENYLNTLATSGTQSVEGPDDGLQITMSTTIYYSLTDINGFPCVYLTKVTGGYSGPGAGSSVGSNIYVTKGSVIMGQLGSIPGSSGGYNQNKTFDVGTGRSWTLTPPSTWKPVVDDPSTGASIGATYDVTLTRGSGSWGGTLPNNKYV